MSGFSSLSIMGRVVDTPAPKEVTINGEVKTIHELKVAVNSFIRGASIATFYSMTLWSGRYDKMMKYLVRGKAVVASGEMYQSKYKNSEGGFGSKLIIELSSLKFVLEDAAYLNKIENGTNNEKIKLMEEEAALGKELFEDIMEEGKDVDDKAEAVQQMSPKPTPKKQKTKK